MEPEKKKKFGVTTKIEMLTSVPEHSEHSYFKKVIFFEFFIIIAWKIEIFDFFMELLLLLECLKSVSEEFVNKTHI